MKKLLACGLFASSVLTAFNGNKTFFTTRSQSVNVARELVGWQEMINLHEMDRFYGSLSITAEYARSFRPRDIAECLFGSCSVAFSGSRVADRGEQDILADYFGLPADFKSLVTFSPHISHFLMDFNAYFGLDNCLQGLYFRIHAPVVHTKWDLHLTECVLTAGTAFHPAGYLSDVRLERDSLPIDVCTALQGKTTFGDMQEPLKFGKVFGRQVKTRVSDLQAALGWNWTSDCSHIGLQARVAAPIGSRPNAEFVFEPVVGNGKHWEVGGSLTSHYVFWENEERDRDLAFYFDAHVTHLFSATQRRSFDFKTNGPGSRYILLEDISAPAENLNVAAGTPAANQYQRRLLPAINKTTLEVKVDASFQVDAVAKLAYHSNGLSLDLGYNFWFRSKDRLQKRQCFESNRYAIKGDAQLYGFQENNTAIPLNATQSKATLHAGQGAPNANFTNANADSPVPAFDGSNDPLNQLNAADSTALSIAQEQVNASNPAILLQDSDIDEQSALLPRSYTHKVFFHLSKAWEGNDRYIPFLGIGAHGEWASTCCKKDASCPSTTLTCKDGCSKGNGAHGQWAIWFKGGVSY